MDSPPTHRPPVSAAARRWLPAWLAVAALLLAAWGQRRFTLSQGDPEAALLWFALAALCLLVARALSWPPPLAEDEEEPRAETALRVARLRSALTWRWRLTLASLLGTAFLLVTLARLANPAPLETPFTLYFGLWLVSIVLAVGAWGVPPQPRPMGSGAARAWLRARRWEGAALLLITLVGGWLRFTHLGSAPFAISGDEGSIGLEVQRVLAGELRNPFALVWGPHPSMMAFGMAAVARGLGASIAPLRFLSALFGTLAIPALFWLARSLGGRWIALASALLLATFPMHLHYSRIVPPLSWDTFFFTAALAALLEGMARNERSLWPFALAGLLAGLDQYVYTGSRFLPLLLGAAIAFFWLKDRARVARHREALLAMATIFIVVAAPIYLYAWQHPNDFNARLNQVGVFQSGWLAQEMGLRGEGRLPILWDQFRRALFGFAFFPDQTSTWGPGTPLALPLLSIGLFFGLAASLRRWRDPKLWLMHAWFWGIILSGGMLTLNPPTSNRLVAITPVVCLFAALGWAGVATALARVRPAAAQVRTATLLFAFFIGATALWGVRAQEQYGANNQYGGGNALIATLVGRDLQARPGMTLVMVGAPRLYSDISPLAFLTPEHERLDLIEPLAAPPTGLPTTGDLRFIVLPERAGEMTWILQAYPHGQSREVHAPTGGELLFYEITVER